MNIACGIRKFRNLHTIECVHVPTLLEFSWHPSKPILAGLLVSTSGAACFSASPKQSL